MRKVNNNLKTLDLNLLVVLQVLLREKHISRAADILNMSQPAVSRAFGRIKSMFNDPILVKTASGYELSYRATEMQKELGAILEGIERLTIPEQFDPLTSQASISISGLELETSIYLPQLLKTIRNDAPMINIEIKRQLSNPFELLNIGKCHFTISGKVPTTGQDQLYSLPIGRMDSVCIMSQHNVLANLTLDVSAFAMASHGLISISGVGPGIMDIQLAQAGLTRRVTVKLSSFLSIGEFCEGTDLLFTVPRKLAEQLVDRHPSLVYKELPQAIAPPLIDFRIYWHKRNHLNPMCQWIRKRITPMFE